MFYACVHSRSWPQVKAKSKYEERALHAEILDIPELEEEGKEDLSRVVRGRGRRGWSHERAQVTEEAPLVAHGVRPAMLVYGCRGERAGLGRLPAAQWAWRVCAWGWRRVPSPPLAPQHAAYEQHLARSAASPGLL